MIEALQAAGYNAEYDANSGSNVIVPRVTSKINEFTSIEKPSTDSIRRMVHIIGFTANLTDDLMSNMNLMA